MRGKPIRNALLAALALLACLAAQCCSSPNPKPENGRNPDGREHVNHARNRDRQGVPDSLDLDKVWLLLSGKADSAMFAIKMGEMMVMSSENDEARRKTGFGKMVFGMNLMLETLWTAKRFFARHRKQDPGADLSKFESAVADWANELLAARKKLPPEYAGDLLEPKERGNANR